MLTLVDAVYAGWLVLLTYMITYDFLIILRFTELLLTRQECLFAAYLVNQSYA